ncbi:hypothetical protein BIW11_02989 [Tropilaelaps mercedesae]|uniref:Uncharacterized protein n=1 Tax=Tropilaelaps mercedesae TaxID=418985 RepID=A0A1V9XTQ9_9ACAR|nr:hypothetical protein BIW11_02989 [Tropilaelaps mercedesae]
MYSNLRDPFLGVLVGGNWQVCGQGDLEKAERVRRARKG